MWPRKKRVMPTFLYIFPVPVPLLGPIYLVRIRITVGRHHRHCYLIEPIQDDDSFYENQFLRSHRCLNPLTLNYLLAGLVAGPAAFSSLTGVLFAGLAVSFLASTLAGARAAGAEV